MIYISLVRIEKVTIQQKLSPVLNIPIDYYVPIKYDGYFRPEVVANDNGEKNEG